MSNISIRFIPSSHHWYNYIETRISGIKTSYYTICKKTTYTWNYNELKPMYGHRFFCLYRWDENLSTVIVYSVNENLFLRTIMPNSLKLTLNVTNFSHAVSSPPTTLSHKSRKVGFGYHRFLWVGPVFEVIVFDISDVSTFFVVPLDTNKFFIFNIIMCNNSIFVFKNATLINSI